MGVAENKALIRHYFEKTKSGDPGLPDLMTDDVTFWTPPGSKLGGVRRGKGNVLAFMAQAVSLYSRNAPLEIEIERMVAEDDWVCVQFVLEAKTAKGRDYRNHYHFAFQVRGGRICAVKEYLDTQYANDLLLG